MRARGDRCPETDRSPGIHPLRKSRRRSRGAPPQSRPRPRRSNGEIRPRSAETDGGNQAPVGPARFVAHRAGRDGADQPGADPETDPRARPHVELPPDLAREAVVAASCSEVEGEVVAGGWLGTAGAACRCELFGPLDVPRRRRESQILCAGHAGRERGEHQERGTHVSHGQQLACRKKAQFLGRSQRPDRALRAHRALGQRRCAAP
jgi:hypothetical protein